MVTNVTMARPKKEHVGKDADTQPFTSYRTLSERARTSDGNDPLGGAMFGIDGRRFEARRFRELVLDYAHHLGGAPTPPQVALLRRCAVLTVWLEDQERAYLDGTKDLPLELYTRGVRAMSDLVRQIGINPTVKDITPDLDQYLKAVSND